MVKKMDKELTWPDGKKYVGEWINNEFNGQGTFIFPESAKYVIELIEGNIMEKYFINVIWNI